MRYVNDGDIRRCRRNLFLLAYIYFQFLRDKVTENEVRSALKRFSNEAQVSGGDDDKLLWNTYDEAMERINGQELGLKELALLVLSWITCAKRQLTRTELQHALARKKGSRKLDTRDLAPIEDIISVCAGLVTVDKGSDIIRLAHYTTQQYFESRREKLFVNADADITAVCATYLSLDIFKDRFYQTR
ncbi:ankyrin repeat protein [Dactylonectria macrodidyma]|uniref:Ankyrin repeat protein n=1 Tax=Dactylonectria macrodidyma TaxID=307937 RepID=A0A9P9EPN8_9HYPO|nr:ankyrin repeat protein [Dactylonectria macrodidyma]